MESDKQYIDLSELFLHFRKTLRRMWIFVLIFSAAFGALAYVRTERMPRCTWQERALL